MTALKNLLKIADKIEKRFEKRANEHKRCNCENLHCPHGEKACSNKVGNKKAMYVGAICDECAKRMPKEYMKESMVSHLISKAQTVSAQPSDVEDALRKANLWELSNQVSPLLNAARVPETASVKISIVVDKALRVNFIVELNPPHPSAVALARLLKNTYAAKMHQALAAAKLNVADTLTLNWITF